MTPLETYLTSLREIRSSGEAVDETSYYGALETFLNEIGKTLKPKVRCVLQLKNRGVGSPDGGLFTEDQLKKRKEEEKSLPQNPARGVIEIKPTSDDAWVTAEGEQVSRYWGKYRLVLVTNYRDFLIVGQDPSGKPVKLEPYRLAASEKEFWNATAHPKKAAAIHNVTFTEYARRVMLHAAPLAAPEDLASFLASYARDALARIGTHDLPALASVRKALEKALGLTFEGEKGEHFFRSTLVQTLFYGIFSAWVLWSKQIKPSSKELFDWRLTAHYLRVPVLRKLFHEVADPGQLLDLNLSEILDWTSAVLNRVDRPVFSSRFEESHAVQYFYEPFLQAFDPELRKQLGVWYTPAEIVQYMVARVDTVLREELNLPDGLADKSVYILDPCCGTGSFLVEVLNRIHKTLKERGDSALLAMNLKEAAKNRVFGFELLPAPFVVSHLQLGLLLQNLGAPLSEKGQERISVYLTNALTGWEPPKEPKTRLLYPELEEERDAAEHVKRDTPILVILGNPPYNGFAGVSPTEEEGLLEPYKAGLKEWGITKNYLDDLYVRFFRVAERRVTEMTGRGVLCYISNFSYLSDPSFVVMRQRFLTEFDSMWFDCMNGDSRETGKLTPDGKPDPSAFSTKYNREGIQVGTAIGLMIKTRQASEAHSRRPVRFRHFWGVSKRDDLLDSLSRKDFAASYNVVRPEKSARFSFRPISTTKAYMSWPAVTELAGAQPMLGLNDNRGQALHDISRQTISERMKKYFDPDVALEELARLHDGLVSDAASFNARETRERLLRESAFHPENVQPFWFKPFDLRWAYIERHSNLWNRVRPELLNQAATGNQFLLVRRHAPKFPDGSTIYFSRHISDQHALHTDAYFIPFELEVVSAVPYNKSRQGKLPLSTEHEKSRRVPNLSRPARTYLSQLKETAEGALPSAAAVWLHVLSMGYTPRYLAENADGIRQDWPRVPLPQSKKHLLASAELGRQIAALLDIEIPAKNISAGKIRSEFRIIGIPKRAGGGNLKETDLALDAGWGHAGKDGITMPGKGKLFPRPYSPDEGKALLEGAKALEAIAQPSVRRS